MFSSIQKLFFVFESDRGRESSPYPRDTTGSSQQSCSLSVARQMPARASTAAACRAYRTKSKGPELFHPILSRFILFFILIQ